MPQSNGIPANPQVAQQVAAAGGSPVQVHQGAPAGIPQHPGVVQQRVAAQPVDFFAQVAFGEEDHSGDEPLPQAPTVPTPPPSTDLVSVDDLLSGGSFSEPSQPAIPVQEPQQAPQSQAPTQPPAPAQATQPAAAPSPEQLQTAAIDYLRGNTYRFSDEEARQALTEPEVVLPALAARLHVNLIQEFGQQLQRVVPMFVERAVAQRTAVMEAKNQFYGMFPKLNRPEWEGVVADSIAMAAQLNQGKDRVTIMREGAALAAYRIRSQAPRQAAPGRPQPFQPANPGSGGAPMPMNPGTGNVWADLAADPDLLNF